MIYNAIRVQKKKEKCMLPVSNRYCLLKKHFCQAATAALILFFAAPAADAAGITVYKDGDKYVKIGGRVLVQYQMSDPDGGDTEDDLFFRALCPYIEGSLYKDWQGKIQWDMGKASGDDEVNLKDAYLQYSGFDGIKISVGNRSFPFSREWLTSIKYQQLVERTFVGDHNYGAPARQLGVHLAGEMPGRKITYGASVASACIDPDATRLDFDTAANVADDWNQGWMVGGRVDFHPWGQVKFSQGDFSGKPLAAIGIAAFSWRNDDDNNTYTDASTDRATSEKKADVKSVAGFEISTAVRGGGLSVDAEYNIFTVDAVDETFSGGLFENGETRLTTWSVEGGYMIMPGRLELAAGYQSMDADTYSDPWTRTSVGVNWFVKGHDIKFVSTYRMGKRLNGKAGNDVDELFLQAQYVF
jgi:phosphate-selective porin